MEETNLAPDHRAEKAPPRPLHQHGNAWTDHLQQRPSQLFDSLDLSSSRGQSGCFDSSKPGDQRQGVMSARARLGGNEVGTKGDGRPERMPEMDHRPSQALDISDAQMPAEGIPPAESAQPSAQVQSEFLRGDSVTVPPPSTDAQSSTSATYVSLKKKVKEGSTQSSFRGHAAVGRPVVHAARWGKGSETESELQKRELREKAKAFATQCREQTRLEVAKRQHQIGDAAEASCRGGGGPATAQPTCIPSYSEDCEVQLLRTPNCHLSRDHRSMMSIEEDQLMASLARLDLRLREKPTGDRPQVPALPASRHPRSANDQAKVSRPRLTTGNTNTFASARHGGGSVVVAQEKAHLLL